MNNHYNVTITEIAKKDIESIHDYISNVFMNKSAAKNQANAFTKVFQNIEVSPYMYPKINNTLVKDGSLRKVVVNSYIVFFKIDDNNKIATIIRVLSGMMNFIDVL